MLSADAPSSRAPSFVWIKLATATDDVFAYLEFHGVFVGQLAALACSSFPRWHVDEGQVRIYMVAKAGEPKPNQSVIDEALASSDPLSEESTLESHGISSGAWLVAKPTQSIRWLSRYFCFRPREETSLQLRLIDALERNLALADDRSFAVSVLSDPQYEEDARNWLPSQLLQRCGLVVVDKVLPQRTSLGGLQWDFRAPVLIAQTEPHPNLELGEFEIFPSGTPFYHRPKRVDPRNLTPTKLNSSDDVLPSAHYFALFEITTSTKWSMRSRRSGDDTYKTMMTRLNERLAKTLDRAKEEGFVSNDARITDLVAVVGVVAPTSCNDSVSTTMSKGNDVPLLLKEMMDAKRFVVFIKPNIGHSHPPKSSPM